MSMKLILKSQADQMRREKLEIAAKNAELPEVLIAKEQAFAAKLAQLATAFQIDLSTLTDINIGSLLTAAQAAGATESDIANASAILLALAKDVEAESGLNWADTWAGLKNRLPGYLQGV